MLDSEDSRVTYTEVSSPFRGLSDIGSPGVDGLPMMLEDPYVEDALQAPPSPDYVPGPEYPPLPEFVPEPIYPEFLPPEDEVFPAEEQPLPAAVSPTANSPGYITDSDPEEGKEDPEEDLIDYPAGGGDDDDDESSDDDEDDDDDVEEDEDEEEEQHPALADSVPPPVHLIARLLEIPSPPPSPLSPWSSPLPQIPSPPLPVSSPRAESPSTSHSLPLPPPIILLHTRAFVAMMRAATPSTYILASRSETPPSRTPLLLHIPLPTPSPPLLLPSTDCLRYEVSESSSAPTARPTRGFRADYGFVATLDDEIRQDPERYVCYGNTDTWDDMVEDMSLMSCRLNMLFRDRCAHARTTLLMERKARLSREAWGRSMDVNDITRSEVRALRTTVLAHQMKITALRAADRARQA
ncbi:hypothetical protein Tco_0472038 [Tanacetum coccineum]